MSLSPHSFAHRFVAIILAMTMPLCCCMVNAAVPTGSTDGADVVVRSCCGPHGCGVTSDSDTDSIPTDDRCGCVKVVGTIDLGIGDLLSKLSLPNESYDVSENGARLTTVDLASLRGDRSRAGPERDERCTPQNRRDLRQRLMLQV